MSVVLACFGAEGAVIRRQRRRAGKARGHRRHIRLRFLVCMSLDFESAGATANKTTDHGQRTDESDTEPVSKTCQKARVQRCVLTERRNSAGPQSRSGLQAVRPRKRETPQRETKEQILLASQRQVPTGKLVCRRYVLTGDTTARDKGTVVSGTFSRRDTTAQDKGRFS